MCAVCRTLYHSFCSGMLLPYSLVQDIPSRICDICCITKYFCRPTYNHYFSRSPGSYLHSYTTVKSLHFPFVFPPITFSWPPPTFQSPFYHRRSTPQNHFNRAPSPPSPQTPYSSSELSTSSSSASSPDAMICKIDICEGEGVINLLNQQGENGNENVDPSAPVATVDISPTLKEVPQDSEIDLENNINKLSSIYLEEHGEVKTDSTVSVKQENSLNVTSSDNIEDNHNLGDSSAELVKQEDPRNLTVSDSIQDSNNNLGNTSEITTKHSKFVIEIIPQIKRTYSSVVKGTKPCHHVF